MATLHASVMVLLVSLAQADDATLDALTPCEGVPGDTPAVNTVTATVTTTPALQPMDRYSQGGGAGGGTQVGPTPAPEHKEPWDRYRLPDTLSPVSYNVTLWPRLEKDEGGRYIFTGDSAVVFKCVKETDLILIHSSKLQVTKFNGHHATLMGLDGATAPAIKTTWLQETTQYLVIQLDGKLVTGKSYQLYTKFQGELEADMTGFYRSHYNDGPYPKVVAASHLQPTDAREVFPCFDEPALKAVFHITIIHDQGTVALSNSMETGVVNITIDGHNVSQTTFEPTKIMSTYLLAFVVCDYSHIETHEIPVLIRLWANREFQSGRYGDYALKVTVPLLTQLESMLDITFPLTKYDQVALPDYSALPMENWGLVTYRELVLWYRPDLSSHSDREWLTIILAHELVHTWIGNLVTLQWWSDLWLNEGFATYFSSVVASRVEADMNLMEMMLLHYPREIMAKDAQPDSRPLSCPPDEINTRQDIEDMFTEITYGKGALVLHMLSDFLTEAVFIQGLRMYLKQYSYGSVTPANLWKHLQDAVDSCPDVTLPAAVDDIMNRWTLQMGFPVVTIDTKTGSISQQHFLLDPDAVVDRPSIYKYEWIIPVRWMKSGKEQSQVWLLNKTDVFDGVRTGADMDWVLANLHMAGYYRVNYDLGNWERLLNQLHTNHEVIPTVNRAQIIDDTFNLAGAKVVDLTLALRSTRYLWKERELLPWEATIEHLDQLMLRLEPHNNLYRHMQEYIKKQVQPLFRHFENMTSHWTEIPSRHTDKYLQAIVIVLACRVGMEECRRLVVTWYKAWMENPASNPIPPHLKAQVYCAALAEGGQAEWDFGWEAFHHHVSAKERANQDMLRGLGCTRVRQLLDRYLQYMMDPDKNLLLDIAEITEYIASNDLGESIAWKFVVTKWHDIVYSYGAESNEPADLILEVTKRFSSKDKLNELQKFKRVLLRSGSGSALRALEKAIQRTKENIRWLEENQKQVLEWFSREGGLREEPLA
ncbi:hypothetical protein ACEWY4_026563 [Coilia grayii]|uniref:Aminopeptidase n=1 Tax=Coilia grayii TaxID=363190 RepID=A0ABD1IQF1_9TELE